jgi:hypothetical protein
LKVQQLENNHQFLNNIIKDREQEIKDIVSQMKIVNEMFVDMAIIVNQQGEIIGKSIFRNLFIYFFITQMMWKII